MLSTLDYEGLSDLDSEKFFVLDYEGLTVLVEQIKTLIKNNSTHVNIESSLSEFPVEGDELALYVDKSSNKIYRWDSSSENYCCIGSDYNDITIINGSENETTGYAAIPLSSEDEHILTTG